MSFAYHLVADDFRGDQLLPLQMLATAYPDVHEREVQKWVGRDSVLDFVVPHLGVAWSNTVNLAALDPMRLVEARRRLGVPFSRLLERRVLRIPVERIVGSAAVVYDSRSHWRNSRPGEDVPATPPESEFTPFDADAYQELVEVPLRCTSITWSSDRARVSQLWAVCSFATCSSQDQSTFRGWSRSDSSEARSDSTTAGRAWPC